MPGLRRTQRTKPGTQPLPSIMFTHGGFLAVSAAGICHGISSHGVKRVHISTCTWCQVSSIASCRFIYVLQSVMPSPTESVSALKLLFQFHRVNDRDSCCIVAPFMQDRIERPRHFATQGRYNEASMFCAKHLTLLTLICDLASTVFTLY